MRTVEIDPLPNPNGVIRVGLFVITISINETYYIHSLFFFLVPKTILKGNVSLLHNTTYGLTVYVSRASPLDAYWVSTREP